LLVVRRSVVAAGACVCAVASAAANAGTPRAPFSAPDAKAAIRHVWTTFFDGRVPPAARIRVLQNGPRFAALIRAQSTSSVAKRTHATVASVRLIGKTRARVVYTIWVGATPMLRNASGIAVRVGSSWKVSDKTFCGLQQLQGLNPLGC
jgi:hypothetical protein